MAVAVWAAAAGAVDSTTAVGSAAGAADSAEASAVIAAGAADSGADHPPGGPTTGASSQVSSSASIVSFMSSQVKSQEVWNLGEHESIILRSCRNTDDTLVPAGLPPTGSWQDLKDHMREAGDVCYADVYKDGTGVVEFLQYDDMKYAARKLDDSKFRSHEVSRSSPCALGLG